MRISRRPINPSRRISESGPPPFSSSVHSISRSPPYVSIGVIIVGAFLLIGYLYRGQGTLGYRKALSWVEGDLSCNGDVQRAIPILKNAYGDSMHRVLHAGPDTCSVISTLLKEEETEAWGVEPYETEDVDRACKSLVHRAIVRVADIRFPLPYRAKSFSLVIVSDALDYLSPKYLNRTLPDLARTSADGLVIFTGHPRHHKAKFVDKAKYGNTAKLRSWSWWTKYFTQMSLEVNEAVVKKMSYSPHCQIFHLKPYR